MILRLVAVALLDLPQTVILPGLDVVRIGLQRALVPDLRDLVVAELAIGVADQIGDRGVVVAMQRLQLIDRSGIFAAAVDRIIGGAIAGRERLRAIRTQLGAPLLFLLAVVGGFWLVGRGIHGGHDGRYSQHEREEAERQKLHKSLHAVLLFTS